MYSEIVKASFIFFLYISEVHSLKVIFERAYMTYSNPKYVEYAYVNVTRYSRRGDYYGNIEYNSRYSTTNNVTIHIYFFEEIRNQYRRSFIEFHHKICDFLMKDPYIGAVAADLGLNKCPVSSGMHRLLNVTTNYDNFPNVFPFAKGRIDFWFNSSATGEGVAGATAFVSFKNEFKRKQGQRKY